MTNRPMTTPANLPLDWVVSSLVLKLDPLAPSWRLGPPGSSLPDRTVWILLTELRSASLYLSCSANTGMFSVTIPSTRGSPIAFMKEGPPTKAPSLELVLSSRTPTLSPSSTVGNQFSITWSANAKGSCSKTSFLTVTTSSLNPESFSMFLRRLTKSPAVALLRTPASSTTPALGGVVLMMSNSPARAAWFMGTSEREAANPKAASPAPAF
mmetsp:Transcript_7867/g.10632  ORF Transcript_7867/g.10632 Transcript_7867/m.10632 type:complete len:211 (-) Transcript_7867:255-887(-)